MRGSLLDINVLLALAWPNHVHHVRAHAWFRARPDRPWSTCAVSHLGFVRLSSHPAFTSCARSPEEAREMLRRICAVKNHEFWGDPPLALLGKEADPLFAKVLVHQHVTDAWLVTVAVHHAGRLATLDEALVRLFPNGAELVR